MSDLRIEAAAAVLHGFGTSTLPFEEAPESNRRELTHKAAAALAAADAMDPLRISAAGTCGARTQTNGWHLEEETIRETVEAYLARYVLPANFLGASIYNGVRQMTLDSLRLNEIAERCAPLLTEAVLNALAQLSQPCSGAVECLAPSHTHGCMADTDSASCTEPPEHAVGRGVLTEDVRQALIAAADEMPIETLLGADNASKWLRDYANRPQTTGQAATPAARAASSGASR